MMAWRARSDSYSEEGRVQENARPPQEDDARLALFFIFFCIACIALMGVVLTAYVYWGFQ
jgi:hypothetical protein